MAQHFKLEVIAEGVEAEGEHAFPTSLGCQAFQGYLFHKPMEFSKFRQLL